MCARSKVAASYKAFSGNNIVSKSTNYFYASSIVLKFCRFFFFLLLFWFCLFFLFNNKYSKIRNVACTRQNSKSYLRLLCQASNRALGMSKQHHKRENYYSFVWCWTAHHSSNYTQTSSEYSLRPADINTLAIDAPFLLFPLSCFS